MTRLRLASLAVLLLTIGTLAVPEISIAVGELTGSNPADGATLDAIPQQVELTFDGSIDPETVQIVVIGPHGGRADTGGSETTADGVRAISVQPGFSDGRYLVYWLVDEPGTRASAFGDLTFTVEGSTPCQLASNAITFSEAALKYSEDESRTTKCVELAQLGTGKVLEGLEEAAFALKQAGHMSEPINSRFGGHMIHCTEALASPT